VRRRRAGETAFGRELVKSMGEALAYAKSEKVAVRANAVMVQVVDVKQIHLCLRLSQSQFAAKSGFAPARILLAVMREYPEVVESVLRKMA